MTPEMLVALDAMRSAWDEATVARMLAGPAAFDALCAVSSNFARDMDIDEPETFHLVDVALWAAHGRGVFESQEVGMAIIGPARAARGCVHGGSTFETAEGVRCDYCRALVGPPAEICARCDGRGFVVGGDNTHYDCPECSHPAGSVAGD